MSWEDDAACTMANGEDPREWNEGGTLHAHYVCRFMCPVKRECLEDAKREHPKGQMRANQPFSSVSGTRYSTADHERWHDMWLNGMSFKEIGRRVGRHHTTVADAIKKLEAVG